MEEVGLLRAVLNKEPKYLLGKSLKIYLKMGGVFFFYCNEAGNDWISGSDDEGQNLRISMDDIEIITGY